MMKNLLILLSSFAITLSTYGQTTILSDFDGNGSATTGLATNAFTPKCIVIPSWPTDPTPPVVTLATDPADATNKVAKFSYTVGAAKTNSLSVRWGSGHDTDGDAATPGPGTNPTGFNLSARPYIRFSLYSEDLTSFKLRVFLNGGADSELVKDITVPLNTWTDIEVYFADGATDVVSFNTGWNTVMDIGFDPDNFGAGEIFYVDNVQVSDAETLSANSPYSLKAEIYPNPTDGLLHITDVSNMKRITILNLLGQNVKTLKAASTIDVSDLNKGVYFLSTNTGLTRKFIKK